MSTVKDQQLYLPDKEGTPEKKISEEKKKLTEQRSGSERQVCTSSGIATLTDSTKRFKLSSSTSREPAVQESPEMPKQKTRKAMEALVPSEEKRKKGVFGIQFHKVKKEKPIAQERASSATTSLTSKVEPAITYQEETAQCAKKVQEKSTGMSQFHWGHFRDRRGNSPMASHPLRLESSVDREEDMYRDAEEIEREKVFLVYGTGSAEILESKPSIEPEVEIMDYCQDEWRGNTTHAKCIQKGYEAVSHKFISIRRVRGDNFCAVRATLFQALSQATQLPDWLQREDITMLPQKLMAKYSWIARWKPRQKQTSPVESVVEEIKSCLVLLKRKWENLSEMKTLMERQVACEELFRSEEEEFRLYEAVKCLMLNTAIGLYEDNEKGKEVPVFSWLLFARDTSSNPSQLMENHLNPLGHTGGLEQVEMFLLAYALQHTIRVYRLYKHGTDEFVTFYPNAPEESWPTVTLITEDDRHYNIPARMCEETSL